jgi:hypothetical protein
MGEAGITGEGVESGMDERGEPREDVVFAASWSLPSNVTGEDVEFGMDERGEPREDASSAASWSLPSTVLSSGDSNIIVSCGAKLDLVGGGVAGRCDRSTGMRLKLLRVWRTSFIGSIAWYWKVGAGI